jgi:hypothetical protein
VSPLSAAVSFTARNGGGRGVKGIACEVARWEAEVWDDHDGMWERVRHCLGRRPLVDPSVLHSYERRLRDGSFRRSGRSGSDKGLIRRVGVHLPIPATRPMRSCLLRDFSLAGPMFIGPLAVPPLSSAPRLDSALLGRNEGLRLADCDVGHRY